MTQIYSLTCGAPYCSKEIREEATASVWIRIGTIAFGVIAITVGILILYKINGLHHLGTTTGKGMIPAGICLIGVGALLKWVKNPPPLIAEPSEEAEVMPQEITVFDSPQVPTDIWKVIFSFFSPKDLLTCQSVCKCWWAVANSEEFWKFHCFRKISSFSLAMPKNLCSWKAIFIRYSPLASFFSEIMEHRLSGKDKVIAAYNPELKGQRLLREALPQFFAHYGNFRFFISHLSQVLVQKDHVEYRILTDDTGKGFSHLAVKNELVFALRKDGTVLQWNYLTGERMQEIQSAGAKSDSRLTQVFHDGVKLVGWRHSFTVSEGYILLKYGSQHHPICEAIPYENPAQSQLIVNQGVNGCSEMIVKGNNLYIMTGARIFIWDLDKKEEIDLLNKDVTEYRYMIWAMKIIKDKLYASAMHTGVRVFDTNTWEQLKIYKLPSNVNYFRHIEVIGSILFGFTETCEDGSSCKAGTIWIYDLLTEKTPGVVDNVINLSTFEIEAHVLPKLIEISEGTNQASAG